MVFFDKENVFVRLQKVQKQRNQINVNGSSVEAEA